MALSVDDIDDIKQLITANNRVLLDEFSEMMDSMIDEKLDKKLDEKLDQKLDEKLAPINEKLDGLIDFVTEALDTTNQELGEQLTDHETRITKLEQKAA